MRGLYAIIDVPSLSARQLDPVRFADAVLSARPAAIQLRDKRLRAAATLALLREIHGLSNPRAVPLFANDRPDLAALAGCEGVHLGQSDLPVVLARQVAAAAGTPLQIGMSVHDEDELERALGADCDYLAFGPVFGTTSKADLAPTIGLAGLERLLDRARDGFDGPRVAIGGLTLRSAPEVAQRCDCGAVIGALLDPAPGAGQAEDRVYELVAERARALHLALAAGQLPSEDRS